MSCLSCPDTKRVGGSHTNGVDALGQHTDAADNMFAPPLQRIRRAHTHVTHSKKHQKHHALARSQGRCVSRVGQRLRVRRLSCGDSPPATASPVSANPAQRTARVSSASATSQRCNPHAHAPQPPPVPTCIGNPAAVSHASAPQHRVTWLSLSPKVQLRPFSTQQVPARSVSVPARFQLGPFQSSFEHLGQARSIALAPRPRLESAFRYSPSLPRSDRPGITIRDLSTCIRIETSSDVACASYHYGTPRRNTPLKKMLASAGMGMFQRAGIEVRGGVVPERRSPCRTLLTSATSSGAP